MNTIIALEAANPWAVWQTVRRYREDGWLLIRKQRVRMDRVALWFAVRP